MQETARDGQALAHAAGEFAHQAVADPIQAGAFQPLRGGAARIVQTIKLTEQAQILERRQLFIDADAVPQNTDPLAGAAGASVLAKDRDSAAPGLRESAKNAQQR